MSTAAVHVFGAMSREDRARLQQWMELQLKHEDAQEKVNEAAGFIVDVTYRGEWDPDELRSASRALCGALDDLEGATHAIEAFKKREQG